MKRVFWGALIVFLSGVCQAQSVGLWERIPVLDSPMAATASKKPSYVMLNEKLVKPTVFTSLQVGDSGAAVRCCLRVDNLVEVKLSDLLTEYKDDPDSIDHFKKNRGWKHIYSANFVDKARQNRYMRALTKGESDPTEAAPYSSVVVAGELSGVEGVPKEFSIEGHNISTSVKRAGEGLEYKLKVDGKAVSLYEDPFPD
ncbi:hypothetical protein [Trinickia fusca]|uniref:Uncharacterized protein n=1 Tax=Trinickia fusca TaxID=2419777 RepID=A0A494X3A4_9BURK|nr:hypothetical protein [Trinickia fusca]RKP45177.1 hypothetical protein D7S89_20300 [Trinickia fusca]